MSSLVNFNILSYSQKYKKQQIKIWTKNCNRKGHGYMCSLLKKGVYEYLEIYISVSPQACALCHKSSICSISLQQLSLSLYAFFH